jgi:hypothetical protein
MDVYLPIYLHICTERRYHIIRFLKQENSTMAQSQIMPLFRMEWTGKGRLDYFVDIMKVKNNIYSKKELFNLFLKPGDNTIVRFNADKLELLACLLHRLFKDEFIRMKKTKGYFIYAENHFTDCEGKKMRKNALKFLSCQVNKNKSRYAAISKEVEEIIAKISKP